MIWAIIPSPIKRALAWALAGVVAVWGVWMAGRRSGAVRAENKGLRDEVKAHERITDAETDLGNIYSVADRVRRLDDFAKRHGD